MYVLCDMTDGSVGGRERGLTTPTTQTVTTLTSHTFTSNTTTNTKKTQAYAATGMGMGMGMGTGQQPRFGATPADDGTFAGFTFTDDSLGMMQVCLC